MAWGVDGVVLTPRLAGLPDAFVVLLLHAVPFALMQPVLAGRWRRLATLGPTGWLAVLAVAATGGLAGTLAIVHALFLVHFDQLSVVVVLLQKLQPVFAIALAAALLRERIEPRLLGLAAAAWPRSGRASPRSASCAFHSPPCCSTIWSTGPGSAPGSGSAPPSWSAPSCASRCARRRR